MLAVLCVMLTGCATPGPPRAPSLNLPAVPAGLTAERVGDRAVLRWTASANSTEGDQLRGGITAVICRGVPARRAVAQQTAVCNPIERFAVQPGPDRAEEHLPPELLSGRPRAIFYEVELLNAAGHSAGAAGPVYVAAGAAPPPAAELNVTARKAGALVRWRAQPADGSIMQLTRTQLAAKPGSAAAGGSRQGSKTPALPKRGAAPAKKEQEAAPVKLESAAGADAGGVVDPAVLDGGTYRYMAQRIMRVPLPAPAGTLELHSEPSGPVDLTYSQVFPPAVPVGLEAVPGGGLDAAAASIDLSWEPASEVGVVTYRIYRARVVDGRTGAFERLPMPPEAAQGTAYRDLDVVPGAHYAYRVTAVDALGNESGPSAAIEESAPAAVKRQ